MLIDVMNGHGLEHLVQFLTGEKNTLDLILTSFSDSFRKHIPQTNLVTII